MKVLVDTSLWSIVFRKKQLNEKEQILAMELRRLIDNDSVEIIGAIRQEILSGISSDLIFHELKIAMQKFKDLESLRKTHSLISKIFLLKNPNRSF